MRKKKSFVLQRYFVINVLTSPMHSRHNSCPCCSCCCRSLCHYLSVWTVQSHNGHTRVAKDVALYASNPPHVNAMSDWFPSTSIQPTWHPGRIIIVIRHHHIRRFPIVQKIRRWWMKLVRCHSCRIYRQSWSSRPFNSFTSTTRGWRKHDVRSLRWGYNELDVRWMMNPQ